MTEKTTPRYPEVQVDLHASQSAFTIASRVRMALKRGGATKAECDEFFDAAMADHTPETARAVAARWVSIT